MILMSDANEVSKVILSNSVSPVEGGRAPHQRNGGLEDDINE